MTILIRKTNGSTEGADPRTLAPEDLRDAGHDNMPLLRVIRAKCLDCCGDQPSEVRFCTATRCRLWPYRMGTHPFCKPRGPGRRFARGEFRKVGGENSTAGTTGPALALKRAA